jgi:AcrR family transcriptional regulator
MSSDLTQQPNTQDAPRALSEPIQADGRRQRSVDSRTRIVQALLDLVGEGEISPSAEQVALRAQVGLRSVFRHFKDMDSLYSEMSQVIEAEIVKTFYRPHVGGTVAERLTDLISRRAGLFERIAPFRRASTTLAHRSSFLGSEQKRMSAGLRKILEDALSPEIIADKVKVEALDLLLSFDSWNRLRRDQNLSPSEAEAVIGATVARMIG